ncbi:hypothetical protein DE146DRAFT_419425 [Phaeosphaeria sp. MPI-PUGE-AT-0046c]|nr:hypothetical protein DE146DRAFT_419425 [Phaeosphaeria sp. MPI-PUGE-AT-0046c]
MSPSIVLPMPLPTGSISIGQLITDPLQNDYASFTPSHSVNTPLTKSSTTFSALRNNPSAHSFLATSTLQNRKIYFVADLHTLKTLSPKQTFSIDTSTSTRPTTHVRMDSAMDLGLAPTDSKAEDSIAALELLKVRCRVGYASEPHSVEDVEYAWTYHALNDEGLQLSIGLGRAVDGAELGEGEGHGEDRVGEEDGSDASWSYGSDDEEGLGGF